MAIRFVHGVAIMHHSEWKKKEDLKRAREVIGSRSETKYFTVTKFHRNQIPLKRKMTRREVYFTEISAKFRRNKIIVFVENFWRNFVETMD